MKPNKNQCGVPWSGRGSRYSHSDIEFIVQAIHDEGTRIIMTTHDLGQARRLADEVIFLHRGRMLEHAPTETFFTEPKNDLAQAFVKGELLWWKLGKDNRRAEGYEVDKAPRRRN